MMPVHTTKRRLKIGFEGIVNTTNEELLDYAYTRHAYNLAFEKGRLTSSLGIDKAQGFYTDKTRHDYSTFASSKQLKNIFYYRFFNAGAADDRLIVHLKDNTFWQTKVLAQAGWSQIQGLSLSGDVEAVNYRFNGEDILLLASEDASLYYLKNTTATEIPDAPHFASIEVYNERVFGCLNGSKTRLWFSDDFDPTNWDVNSQDAGFIEFADDCGNLLKVVSFLGHLYIFRDYGIFRLTGYGDQSTFAVKKVYCETGRIYKRTIVHCGDKIIFLADEGLFAFDGYDVVRIAKEFPAIKNHDTAVGAYLDKRYYLSCSADIDASYVISGAVNNVILTYDLFEKSINMMAGFDVGAFCVVKTAYGSCLHCSFNTVNKNKLGQLSTSGKIFTSYLIKKYKSPYSNLGTNAYKTIRYLVVKTGYPITLNVRLDGKTYPYTVAASASPQKIIVEKCGVEFGIEISSNQQNFSVSPITAVIDVLGE